MPRIITYIFRESSKAVQGTVHGCYGHISSPGRRRGGVTGTRLAEVPPSLNGYTTFASRLSPANRNNGRFATLGPIRSFR
jgi:hypothetical protein